MNDLNISHTALFYGITVLGTVFIAVAGYLYRRLDSLRQELEEKIPSKGEIKALTASITAVSHRLDSLYQALAGPTLLSVSSKPKKRKTRK